MRTWRIAALGGALLALAGCRTNPEIARLERDNRLLEDQIYRLRAENQDLKESLPEVDRCAKPQAAAERAAPASEAGPELGPKHSTPENNNLLPSLKVETGEALPEGEGPGRLQAPGRSGPAPGAGPPPSHAPDNSTWNQPGTVRTIGLPLTPVDNSRVAQISLNPALSGATIGDERSAGGGLLAVVEPRDLAGNILDAPGKVTVVVLDPALAGDAARIARWDFSAAQTAEMIRGGPDRGIYLELPWRAGPPAHDKLTLGVRYTTRDGRKLQVERPIQIAPPGDRSAHWLPAQGEGLMVHGSGSGMAASPAAVGQPDDSPPRPLAEAGQAMMEARTARAGSWRGAAPPAVLEPQQIGPQPDPIRTGGSGADVNAPGTRWQDAGATGPENRRPVWSPERPE